MLDRPLQDLEAWVIYFSSADIPVLRHTKRQLEEARENMDQVDARLITRIVLSDPLMAVRVLAYIQPFRGRHLRNEITTIAGAVMMLGIEPFFKKFQDLPTVEDMLKGEDPHALLGILHIIHRVQRAAHYAHQWAIWRHDINIEEVTLAALLHDLAEVLVWCFGPKLSLEIQELRKKNPTMRSAVAQQAVLGFKLSELQLDLCRAWHLPELLKTLMDDDGSKHPRAKNVSLAVNLARHSANGWNDPALPDDYKEISELLHITPATLLERLGQPINSAPIPLQPQ